MHPTVAEIQVAKAELDHLEQCFRMRIEGDGNGGQLPPRPTVGTQSFVQQAVTSPMFSTDALQAQEAVQAALLALMATQNMNMAVPALNQAPPVQPQAFSFGMPTSAQVPAPSTPSAALAQLVQLFSGPTNAPVPPQYVSLPFFGFLSSNVCLCFVDNKPTIPQRLLKLPLPIGRLRRQLPL